MDTLWQDIRYGLRAMRRSPGFTAVAVLILAVGIGATTTIFTAFHAALLRPLPYGNPDELIHLWETTERDGFGRMELSYPNYLDWKEQSTTLEGLAGYSGAGFTVLHAGGAERISASRVTANFFSVLGVQPLLGRDFLPQDDQPGRRSVLLTYGYWQRSFGGDPGIVGRVLSMDGQPWTVVGVLPPEFQFALRGASDAWTTLDLDEDRRTRRNFHWLNGVARRRPGVTAAQAEEELQAIAGRLAAEYPESNAGQGAQVVPLREEIVGRVGPLVVVLMAAVGCVLLIACANVANLLLVRATGREKEMAIRAALGARGARLVRQVLTESLLLAAAGGAAGVLLAFWGVEVLVAAVPDSLLRGPLVYLKELGINGTALSFAVLLAAATSVLFGMAPALAAQRVALNETLKEGGRRSAGTGRGRLRSALVVSQVALALVLLIGAGLTLRSLQRLLDVPLGFDPSNQLTFRLLLPATKYSEAAQVRAVAADLRQRLEALPGVSDVTMASTFPLTNDGNTSIVDIEGAPRPPGQEAEASIRFVSPNYFAAMRIPVLEGRGFEERDTPEAPRALVVNREWVRRYLEGLAPLGRRVTFQASGRQATIVGVVGDVRLGRLDITMRPTMYVSDLQVPIRNLGVVLRAAGDPAAVLPAARQTVESLDAELPLFLVHTMEELRAGADSLFERRYLSLLLGALAAAALLLAVVGLYGVIAYNVVQRTHEIGVRVALGAGSRDILRMVVGQGLRLVAVGVVLGVGVALATTRLLQGILFGVAPTDAATFAGVTLLLVAAALAACLLPARRAMRVDPVVALRYE